MTSPSPSELAAQLKKLGFRVLPDQLEDFLRRAKKGRWSTRAALAEMARLEEIERSRRSLERRLGNARIGRFKPLVDFDWGLAQKDRPPPDRTRPHPGLYPRGPQSKSCWAPTAWARP